MAEKKEKLVTVELKLRKTHPRKSFRLGTHKIGFKFEKYELNEAEAKELKTEGPKHWVISKEEFQATKKKPAKDSK